MSFWESFWDILLWSLFIFAWVAYLIALFTIIMDLFRDRELSGWWKAVWIIFLLFVPFLTALVYLIARGRSMAERSAADAQRTKEATDAYIQQVAAAKTPSEEIAHAAELLKAGTITNEEYDKIKAKALA